MDSKDPKNLIEYRDITLNSKSPSFCGAKWGNSTLWLNSGETASCHLPPVHKIDAVSYTHLTLPTSYAV